MILTNRKNGEVIQADGIKTVNGRAVLSGFNNGKNWSMPVRMLFSGDWVRL